MRWIIWVALIGVVLVVTIPMLLKPKPVLELQCSTLVECLNKTDDITKYKEIVYNLTNGTIVIKYDYIHRLYRIYYNYSNRSGSIAVKPDDEFIRKLLLAFFK